MTGRSEQIDEVCHRLKAHYIFPEVADRLVEILAERLASGAYNELTDEAFAAFVTDDLQSVNGDQHLRLRFHVDPVHDGDEGSFDPAAHRVDAGLNGYGIARVERLPGNVGYLDTTVFYAPEVVGEAYAAAMTLLSGTDALLLDVRRNRGGDPGTVALICTYLLDSATHLNDIYFREGDRTRQMWTLPYVPGRKFGAEKPVWVLTGPNTFSGAEDLSYTLQQLSRAKTVGESTRGGAHPRGQYKIGTHLDVTVSYARSINPYSLGNWEGQGVRPDVPVATRDAFDVAYGLALEHVLKLAVGGPRRAIAEEARTALGPRSH